MKKIAILASLCAATLFLTNCAKKTTSSVASSSANEEMKTKIKHDFTEDQVKEGMTIFQTHCNKCHRLYEPKEESIAKWQKILPVMSQKAKLTDDQAAKLHAWVMLNAS